jgi:hypothetical protein
MPTTLHATLMCDPCGRATLHVFSERRLAKRRGPEPRDEVAFELLYACDDCETERVWGNEVQARARPTNGVPDEREDTLEHAEDVHGMRAVECPACHGLFQDCAECSGRGEIWKWDDPEPCGATCPIGPLAKRCA